MNGTARPDWAGLAKKLGKYKYVFLVALAGVALLLWPSAGTEARAAPAAVAETDLFRTAELEHRLENALSRIEGAGEVTVVLTLRDGPRQVLAQDGSAEERDGATRRETATVLASKGGGAQEAVKLQELGPSYQGALVVSQGGATPR